MSQSSIIKRIDEIAIIKGGKRVPKGYKLLSTPTKYPYLTVTDFTHEGTVDTSNLKYIDEETYKQIKNYTISSKDIYISIAGTIGKSGIVPLELDGANLTENACKVILNQDINQKYFYYFTLSKDFIDQTGLNTRTTTQPKLALERLKTITLPVPSIVEQKRIVAILDETFAGISQATANTEKNLANVRELFESYLNEVFATPKPHWTQTTLSDLCSIKHGFAFKSEYFSEQGNYILLTPGSFYEQGGFRERGEKTKYYNGEIPADFLLMQGDFLFAMTEQAVGLLGSSLIVPEDNKFLHNQRLGLAQPHEGIIWNNNFFHHQFNTTAFRASVQETASGVKVRHTSPSKLGAIKVSYPDSLLEQETVASRLNKLSTQSQNLATIYQQKLQSLAELKQSLLQKAFSGELTANNMDKWVNP